MSGAPAFVDIGQHGSFRVGDGDTGVSLMAMGAGYDLHAASLAARTRRFEVAPGNSFLQDDEPREDEGGTVVSHSLAFDLPCLNGVWHVAPVLNGDLRAGVMLWHEATVGATCGDAAQLACELEGVGAGLECFESSDYVRRDLGVSIVGRYDWNNWSNPRDRFPAGFKFEDRHGSVLRGPVNLQTEAFHFLPPRFYLDRLWPWVSQTDPAVATVPVGINAVSTGGDDAAPVGVSTILESEYAFARVWMHRRRGRRFGAKAILWWTYNMDRASGLGGHLIGDAIIPDFLDDVELSGDEEEEMTSQ